MRDLTVHYETRRVRSRGRGFRLPPKRERVTALADVSCDIRQGSVTAVVGPNGAGKSTLLRAIAGIIPPSVGHIRVNGTVTTLLRVGAGFNRQLTGRQNIMLGGLAAGLHPKKIDERFAEIEAFAGLGEAIDRPLRTYSTGMSGRLGFAVASAFTPDILLVDEALSAGDVAFKDKCMSLLRSRAEDHSCTVVLVTHALGVVRDLADHCVWLDGGRVRAVGDATEIVSRYLDASYVLATAAVMEDP